MIPLQIQPKANIIPIDDWEEFLRDGEQFLSTASGAFTRKKKAFSAETIYNITTMAIEKFIMAFLMKNGDLAENHTMFDLKTALARHLTEMPKELEERLLRLDSFQEICDADNIKRVEPTEEDLVEIIATGVEIKQALSPYLHTEK